MRTTIEEKRILAVFGCENYQKAKQGPGVVPTFNPSTGVQGQRHKVSVSLKPA